MSDWWEKAPKAAEGWWEAAPVASPVAAPKFAAGVPEGYHSGPLPSSEIDRTSGELVSDTLLRARQGLNNVVGGVVEAPVGLLNMVNSVHAALTGLEPMAQPEWVRGIQESGRIDNEILGERLSPKARAQEREFEGTEGLVDSAKYLLQNPGFALTETGAQVPQLIPALTPGGVLPKVIASGISAAAQNAQGVREEALRRGKSEAEATAAAREAFNLTVPTAGLSYVIPGGRQFEKLVSGQLGQSAVRSLLGRVGLFGKGAVGETVTEGSQEFLEQVAQNFALGDPLAEGGGKAAALGGLLGGVTGSVAGGYDAATARPTVPDAVLAALTGEPAPRDTSIKVEPLQPQPTPPPDQPAAAPRQGEPAPAVGPTADQDALLDALLAPLAEAAAAAPPAPVEAPAAVQADVAPADPLAEIVTAAAEAVQAAPPATVQPAAPVVPAPPVEPVVDDDTPPPPLNIRYGKPRTPPGRARPAVPVAEPEAAAPTTYEQQQADPLAASDELTARAEAILPRVDALSNEDARRVAEAIGGMKAIDRRDPREYVRKQHPDDIEEGLRALEPAPAEAQHIDTPGQPAEAATPAVVAEAVQESADNTPRTLPQAKEYLLGRVDAAIDSAPAAPPMPKVDRAMSRADSEAAMEAWRERVGYTTFEVPGDGTFRVLNTKERLTEFRKKVERSPGFKPTAKQSVPKPPPLRLPPAKRAEVMAEAETVPEGEGLEATAPPGWQSVPPSPESGRRTQSFAEGSTPEMRALSQRAGAAEAESRGLKAAVDAVLGDAAVDVVYLRGLDGLPPAQKASAERRQQQRGGGKTSGIFDPSTNTVYLFTDALSSPQRAAWTALHEIAGHRGLRAFLGADLDSALEIALQNPTVKRLADAIGAERKIDMGTQRGRLLAAEEALAELAAAVRTGDYAHIKARYNVDVPDGIRARVKAAVDNFVRRLRALIDTVLDRPGFTDADVRALLENAWQAVGGRVDAADALDATADTDQTATPEFRRWFGDSKVVDADGKPLVVYHGTNWDVEKFMADNGANWFSEDPALTEQYSVGGRPGEDVGPNTIPAFLSIQNPLVLDFDMNDDGVAAMSAARAIGANIPSWADESSAWEIVASEYFAEAAQRAGYDGIRVTEKGTPTWAAFRPEQIKSATGNRGTFDPDSANILESTEYTPEQQEAMKKAGVGTQVVGGVEAAHQAVQDKLRGLADLKGTEASRRVAIADRFHALKLHERIGTQAEDSSYIAARMSTGLPSVMEAMMLHGAPVVLGGKLDIIPGSKGLIESLEPVRGELNDWLGWMVGRRAQLLMGQGRENNLSKDDITALVALAEGREDRFKAAAIDYLQLKKAALDVGEAWGTIDPVARAAWDHAEYIPFLREREDGGITAPRGGAGLTGQDAGIRRLRGGKAALADPLTNIVQNLTHLMDSALKNHAALMAVDQIGAPIFTRVGMDAKQVTVPLAQVKKHLLDNGVEQAVIDNMPDEALKGVGRMLALTAPTEPDVVRVMRDGKPEFYKVSDPLVLRAMQGLSNTGKSTARRAMIYLRHLLTAGATGTPEFVIANTIRDTGSTWLFTDDPARHLGDAAKGLMQTLVRDKTTQRMMMAGASFIGGHYYDGDPKLVAKHMRRALRAKGLSGNALEDHIKTIAGTPAALFHGWNRLLSATETANRRAIYEAGLREGKSDLQAMFESKDVLDFSMRGDSEFVRFFTDVVPFLNARIQGVYKIGREMQPDKKRNAIIARGAVMAAVSTALALWNLEEHEEEYDKLPEWEKDVYWHIGPGTEYHIRIPKPFELGILFGTVPERIVRRAMGNDQNRESARAMRRAIMDTLQINPVPQALLPPTEAFFNYSLFTGRPIESLRDDRKDPQDRHEWYTSDAMKAVSQAMADTLPEGWVMSPKKLEHLWRGYTAGVGGYILRTADWMVRESTGAAKRPAMSLRDWPGVGRFVRGDAPNLSTRSTEEFYELFDTAEHKETAYKSSMEEGDNERAAEILEDFGWLLGEKIDSKRAQGGFVFGHVREMRRVRDRMSDDRKAVEAIAKSTDLTPEQKRDRIHEIQRKRNDDVHEYVETLRERRAGGTGEDRPAPAGVRQASVPEDRRAEYAGIGKGGTATTAPAVLKGARNAPKMVMVGDWSGLPESVRDTFDRGALGVYDPAEKRAYVVMGLPEAEAKFVAYHEIAGHHGLQGALGGDYEAVLNRARQNPTVAKLADAMRDNAYAEAHGQRNRLALTEEALSELAAARRTGDFDRIEQTWGVRIPQASRPGVKGMVERVAQLTRRKLADLTGDEPEAYNDEQVYSLIEDAWQYVKRPTTED